jgi:AraC-like DNA-binding protein
MRNTAKSTLSAASPRAGKLFPLGDAHPFTPTPEQPVRVRSRAMPTDAHFEPHAHPWSQLAYCASGVLQVSVASSESETTYIVPSSRAVWINPGALHSIHVMEAAELRTLYIDASASPPDWQSSRVLQVSALLREMIAALDSSVDFQSPRAKHLSALILEELQTAPLESLGIPMPALETSDRRLRTLCEALLQNPQQHSTLADWASSIGASERTMHRLFRQTLGMSFQQWRAQVIIAQALPLLARGQSIAQVASATGYQSQSAFSSMFKAAMGQSPSLFARATV